MNAYPLDTLTDICTPFGNTQQGCKGGRKKGRRKESKQDSKHARRKKEGEKEGGKERQQASKQEGQDSKQESQQERKKEEARVVPCRRRLSWTAWRGPLHTPPSRRAPPSAQKPPCPGYAVQIAPPSPLALNDKHTPRDTDIDRHGIYDSADHLSHKMIAVITGSTVRVRYSKAPVCNAAGLSWPLTLRCCDAWWWMRGECCALEAWL